MISIRLATADDILILRTKFHNFKESKDVLVVTKNDLIVGYMKITTMQAVHEIDFVDPGNENLINETMSLINKNAIVSESDICWLVDFRNEKLLEAVKRFNPRRLNHRKEIIYLFEG